ALPGVPQRLEGVGGRDGVLWINDSKATNVASARVAIESMTRPTVLLLGGVYKGELYVGLSDVLRRSVRLVVAYGEAADIIERELSDLVALERVDGGFSDVVRLASARVQPVAALLLATA